MIAPGSDAVEGHDGEHHEERYDRERADRMASKAQAVVQRRFRIGRIVSALLELYGRFSREIDPDRAKFDVPDQGR